VWDYAPQHESTCGFRFNTPAAGRGRFGPGFWEDNAIVTGESRGVLWRTALAKTAAGYVARTEMFARLNLLITDCAISPQGDLVICCHGGNPDWGNGPQSIGRILKIRFTDPAAPQPVLTWAASETETVVAYDRPVALVEPAQVRLRAGRYLSAADRLETMRPTYAVVGMQQRQVKGPVPVKATRLAEDGRELHITSAPRDLAITQELGIAGTELAHDLGGLLVEWKGDGAWSGWLPHPDFTAAREFTKGSAAHDALWRHVATAGQLTLRTQLDLWNMMQPATQPTSKLDYTPEPETVTLTFRSDAALTVEAPGATVQRVGETESRVTVTGPQANRWVPLTLVLKTPATRLDVSFTTLRDAHIRAPGVKRFLLPFAKPAAADRIGGTIPELAGGNWEAGHALFTGKAACATCHALRGEGVNVGPDLSNLIHREYSGVLRDIVEPSAIINPDAIGYTVTTKDGAAVTGTRVGETAEVLQIAQPGGVIAKVRKAEISKMEPLPVSLMPAGLDKALTPDELRDLMTYLLTTKPEPAKK
jgi:putative heme-binding domain-containing protein